MGAGYPFALLCAMITVGILGTILERVFYRRLTKSGGGYIGCAGMGMIICGFGMSVVLMNVAFLIWGADAEPFPVDLGEPFQIGDISLPKSDKLTAVIALVPWGLAHLPEEDQAWPRGPRRCWPRTVAVLDGHQRR